MKPARRTRISNQLLNAIMMRSFTRYLTTHTEYLPWTHEKTHSSATDCWAEELGNVLEHERSTFEIFILGRHVVSNAKTCSWIFCWGWHFSLFHSTSLLSFRLLYDFIILTSGTFHELINTTEPWSFRFCRELTSAIDPEGEVYVCCSSPFLCCESSER